jgi:hypothetical protein
VTQRDDIGIEPERSQLRHQQGELALAAAHPERREQKQDARQPTASW